MGRAKPPRTEMGRLVRARRTEMGWSQRDLAQRIGIRQATLSEIEQGKKRPDYTTQEVLAKQLNLNPIAAFLAWLEIELPPGYKVVKDEGTDGPV